jgi:hypothetical protein
MTENRAFYSRIGYVYYEHKHEAGYNRVFHSKALGGGSTSAAQLLKPSATRRPPAPRGAVHVALRGPPGV